MANGQTHFVTKVAFVLLILAFVLLTCGDEVLRFCSGFYGPSPGLGHVIGLMHVFSWLAILFWGLVTTGDERRPAFLIAGAFLVDYSLRLTVPGYRLLTTPAPPFYWVACLVLVIFVMRLSFVRIKAKGE